MRNKKRLGSERVYIEEGLTRLRSKLYHTVIMDQKNKGFKTWTQEGRVFTKISDGSGNQKVKVLSNPDDLLKIGWTNEMVSTFWNDYVKE